MNRLSSHRIVRACCEHRCKGFRRVQGSIWYLRAYSSVRLTAQGATRGGGQAANSNSGSGGALGGGIAGSPTPSRQVQIEAGSVRAAMILRRPPQAAHSLRSEENTRPSRVAQRSRWPQDAALAEPSAARRRLGNRLGRHDAVAGTGPGRQDTMVAQEMKPGRGNQSRQLLQQVHRRQQERAGPIRPRRFEREGKMVGIDKAQTPPPPGPRSGTSVRARAGQGLRSALPHAAKSRAKQSTRAPYAPRWPHLSGPGAGVGRRVPRWR